MSVSPTCPASREKSGSRKYESMTSIRQVVLLLLRKTLRHLLGIFHPLNPSFQEYTSEIRTHMSCAEGGPRKSVSWQLIASLPQHHPSPQPRVPVRPKSSQIAAGRRWCQANRLHGDSLPALPQHHPPPSTPPAATRPPIIVNKRDKSKNS